MLSGMHKDVLNMIIGVQSVVNMVISNRFDNRQSGVLNMIIGSVVNMVIFGWTVL